MLQYFGAGEGAVFGDMAHQQQNSSGLFGKAHQHRGTLAHLRDAARRRGDLLHMHHLDRVDYKNFWLLLFSYGADGLHRCLGHNFQFVSGQTQAIGAHGNLLRGLLAGHIETGLALGQLAKGLQ